MPRTASHPILEHLERFQLRLEKVESDLDELVDRAIVLEDELAGIIRSSADLAASRSQQLAAVQEMEYRLARIERRLERASL